MPLRTDSRSVTSTWIALALAPFAVVVLRKRLRRRRRRRAADPRVRIVGAWDEYRDAMLRQAKVLLRVTPERWGPVATGGFPPASAH